MTQKKVGIKSSQTHTVKKRRVRRRIRKIRKPVLIGFIAIVVLLVSLFTIPGMVTSNNLKKLGYTKAEIATIKKDKLSNTLIKNKYYSEYLASSITAGTLNKDYLPLYSVVKLDRGLTNDDFILYHRLLEKGYSETQCQNLFANLKFYEITPLLVYDYQSYEQPYIDDCINHKEVNSPSHFELSNNYFTPYEDSIPADSSNVNMLVNKTYYLDSSYTPTNPVTLSIQYAASGLELASEAADALTAFCNKGIELGIRFYAVSAYRPYDYQDELYNSYVGSMGQEQADALSARPGYSEHQTGLTVDMAAVGSEGLSEYKDTQEYSWTSMNCQDYGFILRYPDGKQAITNYEFESWHYRYVGVETAKAVVNSGLTYDEYYLLYLKSWSDPANEEAVNKLLAVEETETEETESQETTTTE